VSFIDYSTVVAKGRGKGADFVGGLVVFSLLNRLLLEK
jgi:hypothetical protein